MHSRHLTSTRLLLSLLLLLGTVQAMAQLQLEPIRRHVPQPSKTQGSAGRTKALEPMQLPFWDDFSFTNPARPTSPNDTLWETGAHVYIGNGLAINPPTIYAASFDGLDSAGLPYNATDILANGYTDELTSRQILLSGADKGSTYLTFFFQWKGNGDPPDKADFLAIEFKDDQDKWVERTRIYPGGHTDKTRFYDTMLYVAGDKYYHDKFQFRFRSYGRESGPYDVWNVDYVHLDDDRIPETRKFRDRALASQPNSMLGSYSAIPLVHFIQNPRFNRAFINLFNLSGASAVGLTTTAEFTNYYSDQAPLNYSAELKDTLGGDILEHQRLQYAYVNATDAAPLLQLGPTLDSIDMRVQIVLDSKDDDDEQVGSVPIPGYDLRVNDTLTTVYHFADYYAYDDGSAEYALSLITSGNRCVVEFPMLTEDYAYLTGFDIYMPNYGISANQTMDFLIYGPSPGGEGPAKIPSLVFNRTISGQGLDTFFHVGPIIPAIQVKDVFYVGWLAPSIGKPTVGVDYGNDTGNRIYVNTNGIWEQNPNGFTSSVMIRPYVQPSEPPLVPVIPGVEKGTLTVFPNPCQGTCFIRGNYDELALMNSIGQPIPFEEEQLDDRTRLSFPTAAPGLYLLKITRGKYSRIEKLIVVD
jgi:hypothetical protein